MGKIYTSLIGVAAGGLTAFVATGIPTAAGLLPLSLGGWLVITSGLVAIVPMLVVTAMAACNEIFGWRVP
jgi:hypothetical protein